MSTALAPRTKSYGPFEVISELSGDGRIFLSLPFQEVVGCKVLIAVADNFGVFPAQFTPNHLWPGAEITLWGTVQGFENCIRRQTVHLLSGPMSQTFDFADGWDTVLFRARNACGGSFVNSDGVPPFPTQANNFSLKVQVYIKPRSGFGTPGSGVIGKAG